VNQSNGCGIHVHIGTSCASHDDVGGHYFSAALQDDPWKPVVYVAAADGSSEENFGVEVTTGLSNADILGRVMVVHELESGRRIACGLIRPEMGADAPAILHVPMFEAYPGYSGNLAVAGSVTVLGVGGTDTTAKQLLQWQLTGLDTACTVGVGVNQSNGCGIHVHIGTSCASHDDVGGHYFSAALQDDPWKPVVYVAAADGSSEENFGVEVTTGLSNADILGRVMVVHELESGRRIACGVITARNAQKQGDGFLLPIHSGATSLDAALRLVVITLGLRFWTS